MKQRKLSKETLSLRQTLDTLVAAQGKQAFSVRDLDAILKLRGISVDTRAIGNDLMRRERLHWLTSEMGESQGERGRPCRMYKLIQARYEWLARQKESTSKIDNSQS